MKILLSLFALIMFAESCNSAKTIVNDSKESYTDKQSSNIELIDKGNTLEKFKEGTTITYKALSRGTFVFVEISENEVLVSSDVNLINKDKYTCTKEDWETLSNLLENVDQKTFTELEGPTTKRFFDGAAHATLTIKEGDKEITTPSFDHGTPPLAIEALVNKVLSIKENAIKQ